MKNAKATQEPADMVQDKDAERVRSRRQRAGKNAYFEFMERPSYLFVWGEGAWGKLGLGGETEFIHPADAPEPQQCLDEHLRGKQIARVVCQRQHTYVLTEEGQLYSCGTNPSLVDIVGMWDRTEEVQLSEPQLAHESSGLVVKDIAGGITHTLVLAHQGQDTDVLGWTEPRKLTPTSMSDAALELKLNVYGWGLNGEGQLAIMDKDVTYVQKPTLIEKLEGCNIVQVACGLSHSLYLTEDGQVYSSGKNVDGQLGLGDRRHRVGQPHLIEELQGHKIVQVSCGEFHSAALTDAGALFTWGNGLYGQLGHMSEASSATPLLVHACDGLRVIYVSCGAYHTAAIIEGGDVLVWGAGEDGQLGQGNLNCTSTPTFCDALRGQRICQVACGAGLTAAISVDGRVWAWGNLLEQYCKPTLFMDAEDRVNQIACGANNMAAWQGPLSPFLALVRDRVAKVVDPVTLLSVSLHSIIDKEEASDSYLLVGDSDGDGQGRRIHTHAIILAVRCAQLRGTIEAEWATRQQNSSRERLCIRLPPDVCYKAAVHFLEYLYCDVVRLTPNHYAAFVRHQVRQTKADPKLSGDEDGQGEEDVKEDKKEEEKREKADEDEDEEDEEDVEEEEETEEDIEAAKVVRDLLQLCQHFEAKELEEEIRRRVASPQQHQVSLSTSFISNLLSADLARALDNPLYSDLTVRLSGGDDDAENSLAIDGNEGNAGDGDGEVRTSIRAHKCILAARSRYFNAMLLSGLKESYMGEIVVAHVRPSLFVDLVRYLYTGDVAITPDNVVELYVAANEYAIEDLVKQCERIIENGLEMETVADLWAMCNLHSSEELKQMCINYILKEIAVAANNATAVEALSHLSPEVIEVVCSRLQSQLSGEALSCASCGEVFPTDDDRLAAKESGCCLCHRPLCTGVYTMGQRSCHHEVPLGTPLLPQESSGNGVCLRCQQLLTAYTQVSA